MKKNAAAKKIVSAALVSVMIASAAAAVPLSSASAKGLVYVGHRGGYMSSSAEENSMDAFRDANNNPEFDGYEFDIYETSKSVYVVTHGTPNGSAGYPKLKQVINLASKKNKTVYIHVKSLLNEKSSTIKNFYKNLNSYMKSKDMVIYNHVMTRDDELIVEASKNGYPTAFWVTENYSTYKKLTHKLSKKKYSTVGEVVITFETLAQSDMKKIINFCHDRNISILCYTNSTTDAQKARKWGVDGFMSDLAIKKSVITQIYPTLSSVKTSSKGNTVKWKYTAGVSGFVVYRSTDGKNFEAIKKIKDGEATSYTDTSVKRNQTYYYKIRGYDDGYKTLYSDVKKVKTLSTFDNGKHTYKTVTTKATLTANGKITKKCTVCGKSTTTTISYPKYISLSETTYIYDGTAKKPAVVVLDAKGNTIAASNYTVKYSGNSTDPGNYTATVTFKGNYSGTKTLSYTISLDAPTITDVTAPSNNVIVYWNGQGQNPTGFEIQYSTVADFASAETIKVTGGNQKLYTIRNLERRTEYYVRVRAYKTANGRDGYSAWSEVRSVTTKS